MPSIKPLGDRVLLKVLETDEKTASGILIPDIAKEKTQRAEVLDIGDSEEIKVKKGDIVIHDKYAGTQIKDNGQDYLIVESKDVIAVIV